MTLLKFLPWLFCTLKSFLLCFFIEGETSGNWDVGEGAPIMAELTVTSHEFLLLFAS